MVIQVDKREFEELLKRYEYVKKELEKCKEINEYLNRQIMEYNRKFANQNKK